MNGYIYTTTRSKNFKSGCKFNGINPTFRDGIQIISAYISMTIKKSTGRIPSWYFYIRSLQIYPKNLNILSSWKGSWVSNHIYVCVSLVGLQPGCTTNPWPAWPWTTPSVTVWPCRATCVSHCPLPWTGRNWSWSGLIIQLSTLNQHATKVLTLLHCMTLKLQILSSSAEGHHHNATPIPVGKFYV